MRVVLSLILERVAPFVLLNSRSARARALLAFGMHWGIFFIMGVKFRYQMCGTAFIPFFEIVKTANAMNIMPLKHRHSKRVREGTA